MQTTISIGLSLYEDPLKTGPPTTGNSHLVPKEFDHLQLYDQRLREGGALAKRTAAA